MITSRNFVLGQRVRYQDKYRSGDPTKEGTVVGFDPEPPQVWKRSGECLVIRPSDGGQWLVREEMEVKAV